MGISPDCVYIDVNYILSTMRFENCIRCLVFFILLGHEPTFAFAPQHFITSYETRKASRGSPTSASITDIDVKVEDEESVEFPPPLSTVDRLKRAATFWSVAIPIVANYYGKFAEMKLREGLLGESMSDEEIEVGKHCDYDSILNPFFFNKNLP
jgi:hypothetical protein